MTERQTLINAAREQAAFYRKPGDDSWGVAGILLACADQMERDGYIAVLNGEGLSEAAITRTTEQ